MTLMPQFAGRETLKSVALPILQPVGNFKEGVGGYDLFNVDPLFMSPIPDEEVCFAFAGERIYFNAHKPWCHLLYLSNHILVLLDNFFDFELCRKFVAGKIVIPVVHNKIVIRASDDIELPFNHRANEQ